MKAFTLEEIEQEIEVTERDLAELKAQRRQLAGTWIPANVMRGRSAEIIGHLQKQGACSAISISRDAGIPYPTVIRTLHALFGAGHVTRTSRGSYAAMSSCQS